MHPSIMVSVVIVTDICWPEYARTTLDRLRVEHVTGVANSKRNTGLLATTKVKSMLVEVVLEDITTSSTKYMPDTGIVPVVGLVSCQILTELSEFGGIVFV